MLAASSVTAQSTPTMKGHSLGETIADFQGKEPKAETRKYDHDGTTLITPSSNRVAFDFGKELKSRLPSSDAAFENGKLVFIQVWINTNPAYPEFMLFEDAELQLITKFGRTTSSVDDVKQNGFGAIFHHRSDKWDKDAFYATIYEVDQHTSVVTFMTHAEHERDEKSRPETPKL